MKTIIWRVIAAIITVSTVYFFTREVVSSVGIGLVDVILKAIAYCSRERMWGRIYFGGWKKVREDYVI